ncbi:MAG: RDD family protein [Clostridia bacterium]|nr:RDD family protein [Clostridia bacterium]
MSSDAALTVELRLAGFWRRFVGLLIDGLIGSFLSAALGGLTAGLGTLAGPAYWVVTLALWQQTIGMRAVGVKVVAEDPGGRVGWEVAVVRTLMQIVSGLVFGLGYLWAAWDPLRQTWHDHVARTLVVRAEEPVVRVPAV